MKRLLNKVVATVCIMALSMPICSYADVDYNSVLNDGKTFCDNWKLGADNQWGYYKDGQLVKDAYIIDHDNEYYVDANGKMITGLICNKLNFMPDKYRYGFLDDTKGSGTYGRYLYDGDMYRGIKISMDKIRFGSGENDYFETLSEATLKSLEGLGYNKANAYTFAGSDMIGINADDERYEALRKADQDARIAAEDAARQARIAERGYKTREDILAEAGLYPAGSAHLR